MDGHNLAKIRHRTFEIFDFLLEASDALASKAARVNSEDFKPQSWAMRHLDAALRPSGVIHVTFKESADDARPAGAELGKDLTDMAELLPNGSRVLIDFEGVLTFDADAIDRLRDFDSKVRSRGSRIVLCNLDTAVRASFFPAP